MKIKFGIMQGRLSPLIGKKIQAFPDKYWTKEFVEIKKTGLNIIEWTLDYKNLKQNPLISLEGQKKIKTFKQKTLY